MPLLNPLICDWGVAKLPTLMPAWGPRGPCLPMPYSPRPCKGSAGLARSCAVAWGVVWVWGSVCVATSPEGLWVFCSQPQGAKES